MAENTLVGSEDLVLSVVALNGGSVVGKTRLQKMVYLLSLCGVENDFNFDYYTYGPYAADLAMTCEDLEVFGRLQSETRHGFHEVPYTIYRTTEAAAETIGGVPAARIRDLLRHMEAVTAIELELAATMAYVRSEERLTGDAVDQRVQLLKPLKSKPERLRRAHDLLQRLGLE